MAPATRWPWTPKRAQTSATRSCKSSGSPFAGFHQTCLLTKLLHSNERDLPVRERRVTANYPMEIRKDSEVGHTPYNGATRQIPATQSLDARNGNPIPTEEEEPLW